VYIFVNKMNPVIWLDLAIKLEVQSQQWLSHWRRGYRGSSDLCGKCNLLCGKCDVILHMLPADLYIYYYRLYEQAYKTCTDI